MHLHSWVCQPRAGPRRPVGELRLGRTLWATIDNVHLDNDLLDWSQIGGKRRLKVEVLAEYPDELSFEKWTLLRLEAHIATAIAPRP